MVVTPEELTNKNNPVYLREISLLENSIDEWLSQWFTGKQGSNIPLLIVDEPRKIVQEQLIAKYKDNGWRLSFELTEDKSQVGILIRELKKQSEWV